MSDRTGVTRHVAAGAAHGFEMPLKTGTDAGVGDVIQFIGSPAPADQQLCG